MSCIAVYVCEKLGIHLSGPKRSMCPNCLLQTWYVTDSTASLCSERFHLRIVSFGIRIKENVMLHKYPTLGLDYSLCDI